MQGIGLLSARPVAALSVAPPGLPFTVPTAMLLVDAAARLAPTPTPLPRMIAGRLSGRLMVEALPLRVVLGHGDALRCWLAGRFDPSSDAWTDWDALRSHLVGLSRLELAELVDFGVHHRLRHADADGRRTPGEAQMLLDAAGGFDAGEGRALRVQAALVDGGVDDAATQARRVVDLGWFHHVLLELFDGIWTGGLEEECARRAGDLAAAVADVVPPPRGTTPEAWVAAVTGLRVDERWRWVLDRAERVVLVPCPLLGRNVSVADAGGTAHVLWDPAEHAATLDPSPAGGADATSGAAPDVASLTALAPLATALGDRTRLTILLAIAYGDRPTAQDIATALGLHPSTVSRQVAQLERVGLVSVTRDGAARRHDVDRTVVRRLCGTLGEALG